MTQQELLNEVMEYTTLLKENAQRDRQVEVELTADRAICVLIEPFRPLIRERQRDYSAMLRMMELVRDAVMMGEDWVSRHRRIWKFKKQFDAKYQPLDEALMPLYQAVRKAA
jgi:hypothetical protein